MKNIFSSISVGFAPFFMSIDACSSVVGLKFHLKLPVSPTNPKYASVAKSLHKKVWGTISDKIISVVELALLSLIWCVAKSSGFPG